MGVNVLQFARAHQLWAWRIAELMPDATAKERDRAEREGWPSVRAMIWMASERSPEWRSNPAAVIEELIRGIEAH